MCLNFFSEVPPPPYDAIEAPPPVVVAPDGNSQYGSWVVGIALGALTAREIA